MARPAPDLSMLRMLHNFRQRDKTEFLHYGGGMMIKGKRSHWYLSQCDKNTRFSNRIEVGLVGMAAEPTFQNPSPWVLHTSSFQQCCCYRRKEAKFDRMIVFSTVYWRLRWNDRCWLLRHLAPTPCPLIGNSPRATDPW